MRNGVVEVLNLLILPQQIFVRFLQGVLCLDGFFHRLEKTSLLLAAFADVGGDQTDGRRGLSGEWSQGQLQRDRTLVASTQRDLPGAAAGATGRQQSGKSHALRRGNKRVESEADDVLQRPLQQIGKPAIAIKNRAI